MKIFKRVDLAGTFTNKTTNYLLLIHFSLNSPGPVTLIDENGATIESFQDSYQLLSEIQYPSITGSENLTTGAISYNAFNSSVTYQSAVINKPGNQKILIPPGYSISNISAGLFLELENLDELRGLI